MLTKLRKLILNTFPVAILCAVLFTGLKIVQSSTVDDQSTPVTTQSMGSATISPTAAQPIVATQSVSTNAVEIEAKSGGGHSNAADQSSEQVVASSGDKDEVWGEIDDAISGLNSLVGNTMFLEIKQKDKGQLEVFLDRQYWDRVSYVTRVGLKTDISNLWHLYVKEYKQYDTSVVYFIDDANDKVIDIFSKAN